MIIKNNSKKIEIPDEKVRKLSSFGKGIGLMFHRRRSSPMMLFDFRKMTREPIHSWFVRFPFLAVWLDDENNILEKRIVYPWKISISPSRKFKKLLEIPVNSNSEETIKKILSPSTEIRKI